MPFCHQSAGGNDPVNAAASVAVKGAVASLDVGAGCTFSYFFQSCLSLISRQGLRQQKHARE